MTKRNIRPAGTADPGAAPDFGLFGPDSVTWRVHEAPVLGVAGLRALFLQSLHPRAVAGVAQHSTYRARPWDRLEQTVTYVTTVIYGSTAEAERAGDRVRAIHRRMWATDPRTGEEFRLDEPELLRWVHITEVESFLDVARRAGVRMTDADADRYFAEQRRAAALVGLDPGTVPGSRHEVAEYYAAMQPRLAITPEAAEALMFLCAPPLPFGLGYTPVRAVYSAIAGLALAMLPAWARIRYGLPGLPVTDPVASLSVRLLRLGLAPLPRWLYHTPLHREATARAAALRAAAATA